MESQGPKPANQTGRSPFSRQISHLSARSGAGKTESAKLIMSFIAEAGAQVEQDMEKVVFKYAQ